MSRPASCKSERTPPPAPGTTLAELASCGSLVWVTCSCTAAPGKRERGSRTHQKSSGDVPTFLLDSLLDLMVESARVGDGLTSSPHKSLLSCCSSNGMRIGIYILTTMRFWELFCYAYVASKLWRRETWNHVHGSWEHLCCTLIWPFLDHLGLQWDLLPTCCCPGEHPSSTGRAE